MSHVGPTARKFFKRIVIVVLFGLLAYVTYVAFRVYDFVHVTIPHSYAAWTVGDLLVEYMDTHSGKWPHGWEDLRESKTSLVQKGRPIYFDFDKLPGVVKVDWQANPEILAKMIRENDQSSVKVVTQLDGSKLEARWGKDTEPNTKVAQYLSSKRSGLQQGRR